MTGVFTVRFIASISPPDPMMRNQDYETSHFKFTSELLTVLDPPFSLEHVIEGKEIYFGRCDAVHESIPAPSVRAKYSFSCLWLVMTTTYLFAHLSPSELYTNM